ncbi:hypothetical protein ACSVDM_04560 [Nocardia sp. JW2]|uniref:hypothetical protein n=1 Tax=Nocardia sp. JW2 TaxID=3450738 RepID=UPI003F4402D1
MLRAEFDDERARLQATGDMLLAAARAEEQRVAEQTSAAKEAVPQPALPINDETARGEAEQIRWAAMPANSSHQSTPVDDGTRAVPQPVQHIGAAEPTAYTPESPPLDNESARREAELREAREAIARSAAARRAAEVVEPVDYDGYDQESEYFRGRNWLG